VDQETVPPNPLATLELSADVGISSTVAQVVTLQTTNFPITGSVKVRSAGKYAAAALWTDATLVPGGTEAAATWTATVPLSNGYSTLQAKATVPAP
jgi:hypothetical protein